MAVVVHPWAVSMVERSDTVSFQTVVGLVTLLMRLKKNNKKHFVMTVEPAFKIDIEAKISRIATEAA